MPYCDNFCNIDAHENIPLPACLIVFVKSKTGSQLTRFVIAYFSSRQQQRKTWNSCCNARPQTSSLQTYGFLTVLALILWITAYRMWWGVLQERLYRKSVKNWTLMNWICIWLKCG